MRLKTTFFNQFRKLLTFEAFDRRLAKLIEKNRNWYILRRLTPSNALYAKGSLRIAERRSKIFALDLNDYPDWSLYFHSETDSSEDVVTHVNVGDTVLDIGGNIGQTALILAEKVGAGGHVYSFEPFPASIKKFQRNLQLNEDVKNVSLSCFGLGAKEAVVQMSQACATNSGANRVVSERDLHDSDIDRIIIKTLDDVIESQHEISKVDFIKIDVEGFETDVIKGAERTLRKYKPTLFIELSDQNLRVQGSSSFELLELLTFHGYNIVDVATSMPLAASRKDIHTDILCKFES